MKVDLSDISIVLLSYNRIDVLKRNVIKLVELVKNYGCELIVVDNASADGSAELIGEILGTLSGTYFIANDANLGVAGGRNTGWRVATRKFILNVDDDISVSAFDVWQMAQLLREVNTIGIVAPSIADFHTGNIQYSYGDSRQEIANFQGACHMIRRDIAIKVGLNDEECSFGGEEIDLSIRFRAEGFNVTFTPDAKVLHDHKIREGAELMGRRASWIYNFTRIFYKHFPLSAAVPFSLRCWVSHLVSGVRAHGPGFGLNLIGAMLRGVHDGRRAHKRVPDEVVRFYRDPNLRPEFGNRPLWRKLLARVRT